MISEWPFGKAIRRRIIDPMIFAGEPVSWRNHEASYDVAELEPASRASSTYVLQEYFVPVDRFDEFVPKLRDVLHRRHRVNVINVSIRHAKPDPGSLLAWARTEVFAFVLYYEQGTDPAAREQVGAWTRELVDAALSVGGSYYLPYQPQATEEQFLRAYPRAPEFFALKARLDPGNKFRNKLWDKYYAPRWDPTAAELAPEVAARLRTAKGYRRDEGQTFLTHPEWYIVYSSEEYAAYLEHRLPTDFPYVTAIGQYWVNYREALALTRNRYPVNWGYQVMLWVIGTSYSVELTLKALYENTIGRLSGWTAGHALSDEDRFAYAVAADYGRFIHVRPWYEYGFFAKLQELWRDLPHWDEHPIRKWERKLILSVEYAVKAVYAGLIEMATRAAYTPEDDRMQLVVTGWSDTLARRDSRVSLVTRLDSVHALIATPRYDGFRDVLQQLARSGRSLRIAEIAGNRVIFLTGVAPAAWRYAGSTGTVAYALPLPTDSSRKRIGVSVPVRGLLPLLEEFASDGRVAIDHIYDY
jgi:hypothetical protein